MFTASYPVSFIPEHAGKGVRVRLPVPALFAACEHAGMRFVEFFTANIRNPNMRRAYYNAACRFASWCEAHGLGDLRRIQPVHVAAYVEEMQRSQSRPSVKQHLAAIRSSLDWLVVGQVIPWNPAAAVRGPRHQVKKGKTPVLSAEEARTRMTFELDLTDHHRKWPPASTVHSGVHLKYEGPQYHRVSPPVPRPARRPARGRNRDHEAGAAFSPRFTGARATQGGARHAAAFEGKRSAWTALPQHGDAVRPRT